MSMRQPDLESRSEYVELRDNAVTVVPIPGTRRKVRLRWLHPGTIERITALWIERDMASAKITKGSEVLKDLAKEPYFAFKEAALMILNNDLRIRFFYPLYWRWLAFRYDETQMTAIISEGKKKLPLMAHYETMAYSMDMRADMMEMTTKEAERYRQELLSAARRLSSKTSPDTESRDGGSDGGSGTSGTGGY